jgi:hypothetical protein
MKQQDGHHSVQPVWSSSFLSFHLTTINVYFEYNRSNTDH